MNPSPLDEAKQVCSAGRDLVYITETPLGIKVYLPKTLYAELDTNEFIKRYSANMKDFSQIIREISEVQTTLVSFIFESVIILTLSKVFSLPLKSLHLYCENSRTIAFNSNGSLFCNLQ